MSRRAPFRGLRQRLSLAGGTDVEGTIERVTAGASLTSENLWLLVCSAMLASIGLDVSSAAVIIGAMLISPLMGPILGVGLGMGITHRALLQRSIRELALATAITITVSAAYFLISPLAIPTTEMVARTRPTLLDVGVAFFGGVAGIVAGSRKLQSLALPGVAIATALMPPLCTAGFGLATGNWSFFLGAFYLYVLNAVFIALSTFLIVRMLHFPHHEEKTEESHRREQRMVAVIAMVAIAPSLFFLVQTVRVVREHRQITEFISQRVEGPERAAPQWEHEHDPPNEVLKLYIAGHPVDSAGLDSLQRALADHGLQSFRLDVVQSDISAEDLQRFQGDVQRDLMVAMSGSFAARDSAAAHRRREEGDRLAAAARELVSAFPEIIAVSHALRLDLLAADSVSSPPAFFVRFDDGATAAKREEILARALGMLRSRLGVDSLAVLER